MKDHLRRSAVALLESAVVLLAGMALYILGYLIVYQEMPRWK